MKWISFHHGRGLEWWNGFHFTMVEEWWNGFHFTIVEEWWNEFHFTMVEEWWIRFYGFLGISCFLVLILLILLVTIVKCKSHTEKNCWREKFPTRHLWHIPKAKLSPTHGLAGVVRKKFPHSRLRRSWGNFFSPLLLSHSWGIILPWEYATHDSCGISRHQFSSVGE